MSGGSFDYEQYKIGYIANQIEQLIEKNGREKTKEELKYEGWKDSDWYKKYPEDLKHYEYPEEVIEKFKEGVKILRQAEIYAHRIDWLIAGDDSEDSFHKRLAADLYKYEQQKNLKNEI
jgi:hypothetical protein